MYEQRDYNTSRTNALETVMTHIKKPTSLQQVMFVLFSHDVYVAYEQALIRLLEQWDGH
jgi:hypothetical protein